MGCRKKSPNDGYLFTPKAWPPRIAYFSCILLALVILSFSIVDVVKTTFVDQFRGKPAVFPRSVYITLVSVFYADGFIYAILRWWYTPPSTDEIIPIAVQNMNLNLSVFFVSSFLFFLFTLINDLTDIFLFASATFGIQTCYVIWLIIISLLKEGWF